MLSLSVQALPAKIKRDVKARDAQVAAVSQKGVDGQHMGAAERVSQEGRLSRKRASVDGGRDSMDLAISSKPIVLPQINGHGIRNRSTESEGNLMERQPYNA